MADIHIVVTRDTGDTERTKVTGRTLKLTEAYAMRSKLLKVKFPAPKAVSTKKCVLKGRKTAA